MWLEGQPGAVLSNECGMKVRTVDLSVAIRAWRHLRGSLPHAVEGAFRHRAVALITQRIDRRHIQQPCVLRAVRAMATNASNAFHRGVLKNKGPTSIHVALGAHPVLIHGGFQVVRAERAMHIMAIGALNRTFRYRVMEGHAKLRFHIAVAALAQLRLLGQQKFGAAGVMHTVATDAAYARLGMRRAHKVRVSR